MSIRKDDNVRVLTGKDRGKTAKVLKVFRKEDKILLEGINLKKKYTKKRGTVPGTSIEVATPIHISNVAPTTSAASKTKKVVKKASKVVSKKVTEEKE